MQYYGALILLHALCCTCAHVCLVTAFARAVELVRVVGGGTSLALLEGFQFNGMQWGRGVGSERCWSLLCARNVQNS